MKYNNKELVLGLDIGISSVGWAIVDDEKSKLVDFGVRRFETATDASEARINRSARRNNRRKSWRKNQLREAFIDFNILDREDFLKKGFLSYTATHKSGKLDPSLEVLDEKTIYHVRKKGLTQELTKRELFLSLYNIVKTRGHFLIEDVDFEKENVSNELIQENIMNIFSKYVTFIPENIDSFKNNVIKYFIEEKINQKEVKERLKYDYLDLQDDNKAGEKLLELLKCIGGWSSNLSKVDEKLKDKTTITKIKTNEESLEEEQELANIYDMIQTAKIIKNHNYLCDVSVELLDKLESFGEITEEEVNKNEELNEFFKEIKQKMSIGDFKKNNKDKYNSLRVIKNVENNYPNGLYLKEATAILENQRKYNQYANLITDKFIEVVKEVIKARIPYYMGPLSHEAKNSWIHRKEGTVKYSYNYSLNNLGLFDEEQSIKEWKMNMISDCSYLPNQKALPKESFISELFAILNDLNIYKGKINDNEYLLNKQDKIQVLNKIFLKEKNVMFKDISTLLGLESFGSRKNDKIKKFNKTFSLYFDIIRILPKLSIQSIEDEIININNKDSKINEIEDIIETLVLYDDQKNKQNEFSKIYNEEEALKLSKLNSKDFSSLSKKFISDYPLNEVGETLIEILLNTNNEQMKIISNATDVNGKKVDIRGQKYKMALEKENKLGINLLLKDGKPFIPMSRPVIRGINETFKVYNQIVKEYGIPKKVVIETAKELGDFKETREVNAKHFDTMKKLYDDLLKQHKENKINNHDLEEWKDLEEYLITNKKKIELYIRQEGRCMISGNKIDLNNLPTYQMDHILPKGFGDNSMNNMMLIEGTINNLKDNKLPLEYIRSVMPEQEKDYEKRVEDLFARKMISENKRKRLLLDSQDEAFGFIEKNLVDTRYIIKEVTSIFKQYFKHNDMQTKIISLQGSYNAIFRYGLDLRKNRDLGDQHHAHDAALIIIVDKVLSEMFPGYESGNEFQAKRYKELINKFIIEVKNNENGDVSKRIDKNKQLVRFLYKNAYNESYLEPTSLVSEIKNKVPLLSWKVEKKYTGQLFNATIYGQKDAKNGLIKTKNIEALAKSRGYKTDSVNLQDELIKELGKETFLTSLRKESKDVLSILGVNDDKKIFSNINSVAVDVYRLTIDKKKNKKKFFAVHIPKVIVNKYGEINEEKYIKLIKEHYGYNDLLNENGEIIKKAFRMRLFKNNMYYDTERNEVHLFNIGSITNKKIEIKRINIYSYNQIYDIVDEIKEINHTKEIFWEPKEVIDFVTNICDIYTDKGYNLKNTKDIILNNKDVKDKSKVNKYLIFELFAKCILDSANIMNTTKLDGQNMPTIDNIKDKENDYIKLVFSPLGIRVSKDNNGKIKVIGKHKKIKKDDFSLFL